VSGRDWHALTPAGGIIGSFSTDPEAQHWAGVWSEANDGKPATVVFKGVTTSTKADADLDDAATLRDAADVLRRHQWRNEAEIQEIEEMADLIEGPPDEEVHPLEAAARALEAQPPMLRDQYVATLRLYAAEPWRLEL
jgi:hypothetical protein